MTSLLPKVKIPSSTDRGELLRNIRYYGECNVCGRFHALKCPHGNKAAYFFIDRKYEGERIVRGRNLDGETLRTLKQAVGLLAQLEDDIKHGIFNIAKWKCKFKLDYTVKTLSAKWYAEKERELEQGKLAPGYVCKLKSYMDNYYIPMLGNEDVRRLFNLKDFALALPERLSLKYQSNIVKALETFFKWCVENRYIAEMPIFPKIEIPDHEPNPIDRPTQLLILEQIPAEHKPIFTFLFYQGARPGEVRALKWDCIEDDTVTYKRTFSREILIEKTKTGKIRHNLIFPEVMAVLPKRGFPLDFVFKHGRKVMRHYSRTFLQDLFRDAVRDAGIDLKVTLYEATKHSFGTQQANIGVPMDILRRWFGHATIKMTEKYSVLRTMEAFRRTIGKE